MKRQFLFGIATRRRAFLFALVAVFYRYGRAFERGKTSRRRPIFVSRCRRRVEDRARGVSSAPALPWSRNADLGGATACLPSTIFPAANCRKMNAEVEAPDVDSWFRRPAVGKSPLDNQLARLVDASGSSVRR